MIQSLLTGMWNRMPMLAAKRSCVTPDMNLGEHVTHMHLQDANKAAHYGLKPRRDVIKSLK